MRPVMTLLLLALLVPAAGRGQEKPTGSGHFEGVLSDPHFRVEKKTFEVKYWNGYEATISVSANGVSYLRLYAADPERFIPWGQITWCTDSGVRLKFTNDPAHNPAQAFEGFQPGELDTLVTDYFRKFAPDAELERCSRDPSVV